MQKLSLKTQKRIDKVVRKIIKDYGCVMEALRWDDEELIKDCEKGGHKKYHKGSGQIVKDFY